MRFSELDGAAVGVWGAGREVAAFAEQLTRRLPSAAIAVAAFDGPPAARELEQLRSPAARIVAAADAAEAMSACDVVVRSPGVPARRAELAELRAAGVPVTTATALWLAEHGSAGVLGITGTKGKSTTAALACRLAIAAGRGARLAGNIGVPAIDLLDGEEAELVVLELSSYQIADLEQGPEVALVTNIYREHTDWHGSEQAYRADKLRLLELPGVRAAVLNARDGDLAALTPPVPVTTFADPGGWDVAADGGVALAGHPMLAAAELPLRGEHNALNLCAALAALQALGVETPPLGPALDDFAPLPHRLALVLDGAASWFDDSISTTPESSVAALASFPGRELVLIAGGQDRGQDHAPLVRALAAGGAALIGVPSTGSRLVAEALAAGIEPARAREAPDLAAAVELAAALAPAGGVVLLSPAAPSYDRYRDFEQRGELFCELVRRAAAAQD